jgi:hypothetical protein
MFAPKATKPKAKTGAGSTSDQAHQPSLVARRSSHNNVEMVPDLQRAIGNQATPRIPWDFSKIPLFPPERANCPQPPSLVAAPPIPGAVQARPHVGSTGQVMSTANPPATDHKAAEDFGTARRAARALVAKYARQEQAAEDRSAAYVRVPSGTTPLVDPEHSNLGGAPMSHALRDLMRSSFNGVVDDARIHADATTAGAVRGLGAEAFTVGRHIYVDQERYRASGPALVAHELTHVGQQMAAGTHVLQPRVRFTGSASALAKVVALINASLDIRYQASLSSTGDLSIGSSGNQGPPTQMQSEFTSRIQAVIADSGLVTEGVTEGGVPLVGSWVLRQIDVDDMNALGVDKPGWNAGAALIHELTEQREGQVGGVTNFSAAHATATAAENAVIGATQESDTSNMAPSGSGLVSGTRTTVLRYPNGTRWRMIVTVVNSNITKVDRVQLP